MCLCPLLGFYVPFHEDQKTPKSNSADMGEWTSVLAALYMFK